MPRGPWTLSDLLSDTRLRPYLDTTGGHWHGALMLYDWNVQVSSAFFESLHYLEVGLRNALDSTAVDHLGLDWLRPGQPRAARSHRGEDPYPGGPRSPTRLTLTATSDATRECRLP